MKDCELVRSRCTACEGIVTVAGIAELSSVVITIDWLESSHLVCPLIVLSPSHISSSSSLLLPFNWSPDTTEAPFDKRAAFFAFIFFVVRAVVSSSWSDESLFDEG